MSRSLEEVIRIKLESAGVENVDALVKAFSELEQSGELTQAELSGLVDKLTAVTDAAGDIKGIEAAIDSYRTLGEQQKALAEATDYAGLRLQAAVRAENENAQVLAEKRAVTAQAREELERYSATLDKTSAGLKERRDAVREAAAAEREASRAYNDSAKAVTGAVTAFDRAAEAQEKLNERLGDAGKTIAEAGLSTDDLAKAQAELAKRSEAAGASVAAMVRDAEQAAAANRELARATAEAAEAAAKAEKDFEDAFRALGGAGTLRDTTQEIERLEAAYETLARSGKLSTEQLARAQEQLQQRVQKLREGTAEYRAEQERAAQAQSKAAAFADELAAETARAAAEQAQFAAAAKRSAQDTTALGDAGERTTGIMGKLRGVLATIGGLVSLRSLWQGLKSIVGAGNEAEQVLAQLEATLNSTGNAAGYNSKQLMDMAIGLRDSTRYTTEQIISAQTRLLSYTDVVGEQFPQALQIALDQAERLGMSVEQSAEVIGKALQSPSKAMEALGRQGFKLEESQRKLLKELEATGRMAEAQAIIIDMLNESYAGAAAAARVSTISGLWKTLTDHLGDFYAKIANSGVLDYFKVRLDALGEAIARLKREGQLDQWAKTISDGIITGARAMEQGIRWAVEYGGAIMSVVKAYVAVRTVQATMRFADMIAGWHRTAAATLAASTAANTAAGSFGRLGAMIRAIPATIKIGIAVIGYELLEKTALKLAEIAARNSEAAKELERFQAARAAQVQEEINQLHLLQAETIRYRDVQVQSAVDIAKMTQAEIDQYGLRILLAQEYAKQQLGIALRERELRGETEETNKAVADAIARVQELRGAWDTVAEGMRLAEDAARRAMSVDATLLVKQLQSAAGEAEKTRLAVASMFEGLEDASVTGLGDIALAIAEVGSESDRAARHVREGLAEELKKLTGEQLLRFSSAAQAAFEHFGTGAQQAATVANTVLLTAMERLGLKGSELGVSITDAGRDIIATFQVIAESAHASAEQVQNAFRAALDAAATIDEVKALEAAFQSAFAAGRISADQLAVGMQAIQTRMAAIRAEIDPLADAFRTLGIQSQASLDAARDAARGAFDRIVAGAREGKASLNDIQAAFEAYARAELAASANSNATTRQQVENMLRLKGGALGATEALERLGLVGADAPARIKPPADRSTASLHGLADAADRASGSIGSMGDSAENAGDQLDRLGRAAAEQSYSLGQMSKEATQAYMALNKYAGTDIWHREMNRLTERITEQKEAFRKEEEQLKVSASQYENLGMHLARVRSEYNYLTAEQQFALAEARARAEAEGKTTSVLEAQAESIRDGNAALRERNALLDQQKQVTQVQEIKRTTEVNVNFTAKAARIEFDPSDLTDSQWRQVAAKVIEIIKRDMP